MVGVDLPMKALSYVLIAVILLQIIFFEPNSFMYMFNVFSKNSFRNTIRVSNGCDPDQERHSVGPDLDPNCLQRLSADDKSHS